MMQTLLTVPINEIFIDTDFNCRGVIAPIDVVDLAKDIERNGLIQPVTVAPYGKDGKKYRLIAGYRRHAAHLVLKKDTIDCIVRTDMQDEMKARIFNLSENIQRQDLNILQEAKAIEKIFKLGLTVQEIANAINKSYGWIQVRGFLLKLPEIVQREIAVGSIPQSQIRDLYSIFIDSGEEQCFEAAKKIKEAKSKGIYNLNLKPKSKKQARLKRQRKQTEILELMYIIQDTIGNGFFTRVLAWAGGEISDIEVHVDLRDEAKKLGKEYILPDYMVNG